MQKGKAKPPTHHGKTRATRDRARKGAPRERCTCCGGPGVIVERVERWRWCALCAAALERARAMMT